MIRVLIADDHKLMREGLKALLANVQDIEVIGEARDGLEAVDAALRLAPDVVLMDMAMPDVNGVRATEQIHALDEKIKVLFVSGHADELILRQALRSGAQGYLLKTANPLELPLAIRAVHRGEIYFSPDVFGVLSEEYSRLRSAPAASRTA
jgi:two-component system, NarL family, response regulator NreC